MRPPAAHIPVRLLMPLFICFWHAVTVWSAPRQDPSDGEKNDRAKRKSFFTRAAEPFANFFFGVDTTYVKLDDYHFQALFQNNYSYEIYKVKSEDGKSIGFRPKESLKIGPYVGWSFIFAGFAIDVLHLNDKKKRREWDISLYTLPFVIDIYYRKSGGNYNIYGVNLGDGIDTAPLTGTPFQGFDSGITGFDLYYIFNHRKFSYPAAFNQSTQQKKTSGSPIIGFGFTRHRLNIDWDGLALLFNDKLGADVSDIIESSLEFDKITFTDLSLSGGYACNYVFAENWLLGASLSVGLSYKQSISDTTKGFDVFGSSISNLKDFRFSDLTFNFMGRFGIVYNNGKWFAGISSTIHSYNYSNTNFYTNNSFGYINGYIGFNFGRKKQH